MKPASWIRVGLRLRDLLLRIDERLLDNDGPSFPAGRMNGEFAANRCILDRHHRVSNVVLQPRGVNSGCHESNSRLVSRHDPLRHVEVNRRALNLDPDALPFYSFRRDSLQSLLADEISRLV